MIGVAPTFHKFESVIINQFEDDIFYAELLLTYHDKSYEIDYPPAKAITLGVRAQAPIFVDEKVLDKAAIEVPSSGEVI